MLACVKFAKCREGAKIPSRVDGSAGLDLYACFDEEYMSIKPHESKLIPTGIKMAMDPDFFMLIEERGSTGSKGIKKSAGIIDADFRGEIWVVIFNSTDNDLFIAKESAVATIQTINANAKIYPYEKAIAQGLILPVPELDVEVWEESEVMAVPSMRGEGQLGHSGK